MSMCFAIPISTPPEEVIATQLSSPIDYPSQFSVQHHENYPTRLKSAKEMNRTVVAEMEAIKAERKVMRDISLDWEIKDRVAQGLNDIYILQIHSTIYCRLRKFGHGYHKWWSPIYVLARINCFDT